MPMSEREICEWIVEHGTCLLSFTEVDKNLSCRGTYGVNQGSPCPLAQGKFNCCEYGGIEKAAQAWLETNGEDCNV